MLIYIAVVALVNLGLGFALAVHLARQHRRLRVETTGFSQRNEQPTKLESQVLRADPP